MALDAQPDSPDFSALLVDEVDDPWSALGIEKDPHNLSFISDVQSAVAQIEQRLAPVPDKTLQPDHSQQSTLRLLDDTHATEASEVLVSFLPPNHINPSALSSHAIDNKHPSEKIACDQRVFNVSPVCPCHQPPSIAPIIHRFETSANSAMKEDKTSTVEAPPIAPEVERFKESPSDDDRFVVATTSPRGESHDITFNQADVQKPSSPLAEQSNPSSLSRSENETGQGVITPSASLAQTAVKQRSVALLKESSDVTETPTCRESTHVAHLVKPSDSPKRHESHVIDTGFHHASPSSSAKDDAEKTLPTRLRNPFPSSGHEEMDCVGPEWSTTCDLNHRRKMAGSESAECFGQSSACGNAPRTASTGSDMLGRFANATDVSDMDDNVHLSSCPIMTNSAGDSSRPHAVVDEFEDLESNSSEDLQAFSNFLSPSSTMLPEHDEDEQTISSFPQHIENTQKSSRTTEAISPALSPDADNELALGRSSGQEACEIQLIDSSPKSRDAQASTDTTNERSIVELNDKPSVGAFQKNETFGVGKGVPSSRSEAGDPSKHVTLSETPSSSQSRSTADAEFNPPSTCARAFREQQIESGSVSSLQNETAEENVGLEGGSAGNDIQVPSRCDPSRTSEISSIPSPHVHPSTPRTPTQKNPIHGNEASDDDAKGPRVSDLGKLRYVGNSFLNRSSPRRQRMSSRPSSLSSPVSTSSYSERRSSLNGISPVPSKRYENNSASRLHASRERGIRNFSENKSTPKPWRSDHDAQHDDRVQIQSHPCLPRVAQRVHPSDRPSMSPRSWKPNQNVPRSSLFSGVGSRSRSSLSSPPVNRREELISSPVTPKARTKTMIPKPPPRSLRRRSLSFMQPRRNHDSSSGHPSTGSSNSGQGDHTRMSPISHKMEEFNMAASSPTCSKPPRRQRPRFTVPHPFALKGPELQERSRKQQEETRRKEAEMESRPRVFKARPMPDFSRPHPRPYP